MASDHDERQGIRRARRRRMSEAARPLTTDQQAALIACTTSARADGASEMRIRFVGDRLQFIPVHEGRKDTV